MAIFTQEHPEMKIYLGRKAAALKSERTTGEPFWKTPHFRLRLIAHQDFFLAETYEEQVQD